MRTPVSGVLVSVLLSGLAARAEPPMPPVLAEDAPLEDRGHRFRWGLAAGGGPLVPYGGLALMGELRLGYQRDRRFSITGTISAGGIVGVGAPVYGSQVVFGTIAEFTLFDWLYFGGGPVLSNGAFNAFIQPARPDGLTSVGDYGWRPGLDLRVGLSAAASHPPTFNRGGFNIGLHALLLVHPGASLGWAWQPGKPSVTTSQALVTFTPMLMLGYDSR